MLGTYPLWHCRGNFEVTTINLLNRPLLGVGLGAHPVSYEIFAPGYMREQYIWRLNRQSASCLLFRLLSETGVVGTILFIDGFLSIVFKGRRVILKALTKDVYAGPKTQLLPISVAVGIMASCVGLFFIYLVRFGVYYDPELWVLLALTACVPGLVSRRRAPAN